MRLKGIFAPKKKKAFAPKKNVPVCIYGPPEMLAKRGGDAFAPEENEPIDVYGPPAPEDGVVLQGEEQAGVSGPRPDLKPDPSLPPEDGVLPPAPKKPPFDPRRNVAVPLYGPPRGIRKTEKE